MATKLHGPINLSKIPKELITTNRAGDKVLWIDVLERREEGKYGQTHTITCYNRDTRETIYLADLTPQDFGDGGDTSARRNAAPQDEGADDLPF